MKLSSFLHFAAFGVRTILLREKKPILGTVIVTDRCNLKCRHCSVPVSYTHLDVYKRQGQICELPPCSDHSSIFSGNASFLSTPHILSI